MKAVIKNVWYCFLCFFLIITIGCTGKSTKQADVKTVSCDTLTGETSATVMHLLYIWYRAYGVLL